MTEGGRKNLFTRGGEVRPDQNEADTSGEVDPFFSSASWEDERERNMMMLSDLLGGLLEWLTRGNMNAKGWHLCVFRKTIAMVWAMRPDLLENQSLRQMAKQKGVAANFTTLSYHVKAITDEYGHFHHGTKGERAKESYRKSWKERNTND